MTEPSNHSLVPSRVAIYVGVFLLRATMGLLGYCKVDRALLRPCLSLQHQALKYPERVETLGSALSSSMALQYIESFDENDTSATVKLLRDDRGGANAGRGLLET
ncbi:hypothetical protein Pyn_38089 [Prunus yedoensis var. nudiflora]|uniref:Uncharacterized protein n=1 Tax=Prunus yedoensis var. nudiflora TaxID=2094558 RepID=A0A314ZEE2_PRUYE|nr:hypothetical protein Pyn_38089 [Prunus yedoensis var. nudiflora]